MKTLKTTKPFFLLALLVLGTGFSSCATSAGGRYYQIPIDAESREAARALFLEVVENYQALESYSDVVMERRPQTYSVYENGEESLVTEVAETNRIRYRISEGARFTRNDDYRRVVSDGRTIWFEDGYLLRYSQRDFSEYVAELFDDDDDDDEEDEDIEIESFPILTFHPVTIAQLINGDDFTHILPGLYDFISVEADVLDGKQSSRIDLLFDWDKNPRNGYALSRLWVDPATLLIQRFGVYYGPFSRAADLNDLKKNEWVEYDFTAIEIDPSFAADEFTYNPPQGSREVLYVYDRYELEADLHAQLGSVLPDPGFISLEGNELSLREFDGNPTLLMIESLASHNLEYSNRLLSELRREFTADQLSIVRMVFDVPGSRRMEEISIEEYLARFPGSGMVTRFSRQSDLAEAWLERYDQLAILLDENGVFQAMPSWYSGSDSVIEQLERLAAGEDLFDPAGVARARALTEVRRQTPVTDVSIIDRNSAVVSGYSGELIRGSRNINPSSDLRFDIDSDGIDDYVRAHDRISQSLTISAYSVIGNEIFSLSVPWVSGNAWLELLSVFEGDADGMLNFLILERKTNRFDDTRESSLLLVSESGELLWAVKVPPGELSAANLVPDTRVDVVVDDWNVDGMTDIVLIQQTILMSPSSDGGYFSDEDSPAQQRIIVLDSRGSVQWQAEANFPIHPTIELTPRLPDFDNRRALSLNNYEQFTLFFWPE